MLLSHPGACARKIDTSFLFDVKFATEARHELRSGRAPERAAEDGEKALEDSSDEGSVPRPEFDEGEPEPEAGGEDEVADPRIGAEWARQIALYEAVTKCQAAPREEAKALSEEALQALMMSRHKKSGR
mmetsp:Transcript_105413/g.319858  ORF Transcript_105413/g.319858 Transcript_105413/m.319858 type:complete len:129 (+) Transcript_105413:259-645(+)